MRRNLVLILILGSFFFLKSCNSKKKDSFTIAAAANMQFVIYELANAFYEKSGISSEVILGSSGKLTAQIVEGAPFDLFLSADIKYPNELFKKGFSVDQPEVYAYGSLVLWTLKDDLVPDLEVLTSGQVKHVAMGNPKTAPYGVAAMQVLNHTDLYATISSKIVYGESVSQTNQFIISQAAEIGFTSKSVVLSSQMEHEGSWEVLDKELYNPMAQAMVILNNREIYKEEAVQFKEFMLSLEGKEILHKFGYDLVE
ncbi:molybdate ABC transporter substrate-binding protein [Lutimonas sp.]|uniref:molybdate ABC transporter substrate-binding protein n=1 Tax=Lutimonas sp. TaxID=1872403 RepID=UPI003D9BF428